MAHEADAASSPHVIGFNLAVIMVIVALGGIGLAYLIDGLRPAAQPGSAVQELAVTRTLSGRDLEIPANWFRYDEQRADGFARQIDLRFSLPLGLEGKPAIVDVTLMPRSRARPSASLLDGVYLHQFLPGEVAGPLGLVGKPLRADAGYAGEIVWYDPLAAAPFVAKCSPPVADARTMQCLRTTYLGPGIAAVYAFGSEVLENWRQFDTVLNARLATIGAL